MSNENGFNWKYLIPGYGCYVIKKSETTGKGKFYALNVFMTLVLLGIIGGDSDDGKTVSGSSGTETEVSEKVKWKIGDSIKTEKFDIKVSSVTTKASVGGSYLSEKAADGAIFIAVNFNYKNITKEPIGSSSVPEIKIFDPNGVEYDEASGATAYYQTEINLNKKIISDINPGISQKDAVVFEVSKDLWKNKGWKLVLDADEDIEIMIK